MTAKWILIAVAATALASGVQAQDNILEQLRQAGYSVVDDKDNGAQGRVITVAAQQPSISLQTVQQRPSTISQRASQPSTLTQRASQPRISVQQQQQRVQQQEVYPQRAYEYGYQLDDTQGSHGHVEKRGDDGRVEGEYSINLGDGRVRVVKYVADENGYRADVSTDELGTESKNPNDVYIGSTAISGYEAALKYGPFAPPHYEQPLQAAERPEAPRVAQQQFADTKVNLPTYGTFAAHG